MTVNSPHLTKLPAFLHGGDYNPEQWSTDIWREDIRLMKLAGINAPTLGVFAWSALETAEGQYEFEWLDQIIELISDAGMSFVLATPSAATPPWMSEQYPETLRVRHDGVRHPHKVRVNYCLSSPVYRNAAQRMARKLAERYGKHPGLLLWHVNNEYHDDCHCDLCQNNFREWLQNKYGDLETLNDAWWTKFWSHRYTSWSQIRSPQPWPHGEWSIQGLTLDWRRFTGEQHASLFRNEAEVLRDMTPDIPLTHNMHGIFTENMVTQWKVVAKELDFVSWDNYPHYQDNENDVKAAITCAFQHNLIRGLNNGKPFMVMESSPGSSPGTRQQRPGALRRTALQAIGHGSDSVMYFQWRNGRGEIEKFHGSVVEHRGDEHTRYFKELAAIGSELQEIKDVIGSEIPSDVGLIFDQEIHWAMELSTTARWDNRDYVDACHDHYAPFWLAGVNTTIVPPEYDLSSYKLVIAPLVHLLSDEAVSSLKNYVRDGGTLVLTYWSGYVNENDLCFSGGFPGPLKEICGLWSEELDAIPAGQTFDVNTKRDGLKNSYQAINFADLIRTEGAEVLATFGSDYLDGQPALCKHQYGKGTCYYIGFQAQQEFLHDFYNQLIDETQAQRNAIDIPHGVSVQRRQNATQEFLCVQNFACSEQTLQLGEGWCNLGNGTAVNAVQLQQRGAEILVRPRS